MLLGGNRAFKRQGEAKPGVLAGVRAFMAAVVVVAPLVGCAERSSAPADPTGVPPASGRLVSELAVLRRPQTAADLLPASVARTLPGTVVANLSRLAATVTGKAGTFRLYLAVVAVGPCRDLHEPASDWVALVTVVQKGPGAGYGPGGWGYSMQYAADESPAASIFPFGGGVSSNVVPDGVVRVKWVFGPPHAKHVTVFPTVGDNVAFAPISGDRTLAAATWYLADGRVITSREETKPLTFCGVTPGETPGAKHIIAQALGQHFALFRTARLTEPLSVGIFYARYFDGWRLGLNFAQARFVRTGTGMFGPGSGVWVVPGRRGACIMEGVGSCYSGYGGGNGVCTVLIYAGAESGGMRFSDRDGHGRNTYSGFVPDGNRTVSIVLARGAIRTVRVIDNVYSITVNGRAIALIDRNAFGHRERFPLFVNYNMF